MKGVRATTWTSAITPGDGDPRHGLNGYSNLKCRCDICRKANFDYCQEGREHRARRLAEEPDLVPHGTYSTYTNYKCRCADCRRANAERARRYNKGRTA